MTSGKVQMLRQVVARTPAPAILRRTQRGLRVVLYHHLAHDCSYTRQIDVSTSPDLFEAHIGKLVKDYDIVGLDDVLAGDLPRRPLLVTFDDAYRSVLEVGAPILASHGIRPVFFVSTAPVFEGEILLDNLLSHAETEEPRLLAEVAGVPRGTSTADILRGLLPDRTSAQRQELKGRLAEALGGSAKDWCERSGLYLKPEELTVLADRYQFSFGGHTRTHVHVRGLAQEELQSELTGPIQQLAGAVGQAVRVFSFPFGDLRDGTADALTHMQAAGVERVFYVHSRVNPASSNQFLYRSSVGSMQASELASEMEVMALCRRVVAGVRKNHPLVLTGDLPMEGES
ncbi:MAG: polysaccharide deacetylase family protein [Phycisphaerales bacterium]|nr:polysaccharide deacetylase family protein [Phycisphaerales bacterium]